jgi:hypothetical protein
MGQRDIHSNVQSYVDDLRTLSGAPAVTCAGETVDDAAQPWHVCSTCYDLTKQHPCPLSYDVLQARSAAADSWSGQPA